MKKNITSSLQKMMGNRKGKYKQKPKLSPQQKLWNKLRRNDKEKVRQLENIYKER